MGGQVVNPEPGGGEFEEELVGGGEGLCELIPSQFGRRAWYEEPGEYADAANETLTTQPRPTVAGCYKARGRPEP